MSSGMDKGRKFGFGFNESIIGKSKTCKSSLSNEVAQFPLDEPESSKQELLSGLNAASHNDLEVRDLEALELT